jgi:hypothetical protein
VYQNISEDSITIVFSDRPDRDETNLEISCFYGTFYLSYKIPQTDPPFFPLFRDNRLPSLWAATDGEQAIILDGLHKFVPDDNPSYSTNPSM